QTWQTAVLYHFIHAVALLVLALYGTSNRGAWWLLLAGILLFSGSLYAIALTNIRWLGPVTPLGGLCFLARWAWLIVAPARSTRLTQSPARFESAASTSRNTNAGYTRK